MAEAMPWVKIRVSWCHYVTAFKSLQVYEYAGLVVVHVLPWRDRRQHDPMLHLSQVWGARFVLRWPAISVNRAP